MQYTGVCQQLKYVFFEFCAEACKDNAVRAEERIRRPRAASVGRRVRGCTLQTKGPRH